MRVDAQGTEDDDDSYARHWGIATRGWARRIEMNDPTPAKAEPGEYLILHTEVVVGEAALFWRPNNSGYTIDFDQAGRYTREEAHAKGHRNTDIPVPVDIARACVRASVWMGKLRERMDCAPGRKTAEERIAAAEALAAEKAGER